MRALFENLIIADLKKQFYNRGLEAPLYLWCEKNGSEIDCLIEKGSDFISIEIKSGKTIHRDFLRV